MSCSTGRLAVPLSADVSTANIHDSKPYDKLIDSFAGLVQNILCDPAYDNSSLYESSKNHYMRLICPIKKYHSTPPERLKLVEFYNSVQGQKLYAQRKISVEPLFEYLKDMFNIRKLSVKGLANVHSFVLICVLVYQLAVYYNCIAKVENPRIVKRMLCC